MFPTEMIRGRKVLYGLMRENNTVDWREFDAEQFYRQRYERSREDDLFGRRRGGYRHGAGLQASLTWKTVALVASTVKTVAGIKCAANQCVRALELSYGFDGATSTNAAVIVEVGSCTWATNSPGTNSTSFTLLKQDTGRAETVQTTGGFHWTTEPTVITINRTLDVPQYNGFTVIPLAQWYSTWLLVGGNGMVVRMTSPNNVNCSGALVIEE